MRYRANIAVCRHVSLMLILDLILSAVSRCRFWAVRCHIAKRLSDATAAAIGGGNWVLHVHVVALGVVGYNVWPDDIQDTLHGQSDWAARIRFSALRSFSVVQRD